MEQTIKNMELIILKMDKELNSRNTYSTSTLVNTYYILLRNLIDYAPSNLTDDEISKMEVQYWSLKYVNRKSNDLINRSLEQSQYKEAETLSIFSSKIDKILNDITNFIPKVRMSEFTQVLIARDHFGKPIYEKKAKPINDIIDEHWAKLSNGILISNGENKIKGEKMLLPAKVHEEASNINITFNVEKINGNKSDIENFTNSILKTLKRECADK
ncbi:hypothetical protein [Psychrobacillus phage Perkons]|nr:hypothetical protein [Psychrobacillus phage Perkons]